MTFNRILLKIITKVFILLRARKRQSINFSLRKDRPQTNQRNLKQKQRYS